MPFNLSGTGFQPVVFTLTDGQDARPTSHQTEPSPAHEIGMEAGDILEVSGRSYVTTLDELGQSPRIRRSGLGSSRFGSLCVQARLHRPVCVLLPNRTFDRDRTSMF